MAGCSMRGRSRARDHGRLLWIGGYQGRLLGSGVWSLGYWMAAGGVGRWCWGYLCYVPRSRAAVCHGLIAAGWLAHRRTHVGTRDGGGGMLWTKRSTFPSLSLMTPPYMLFTGREGRVGRVTCLMPHSSSMRLQCRAGLINPESLTPIMCCCWVSGRRFARLHQQEGRSAQCAFYSADINLLPPPPAKCDLSTTKTPGTASIKTLDCCYCCCTRDRCCICIGHR